MLTNKEALVLELLFFDSNHDDLRFHTPTHIAESTHEKITRAWALKICKKFVRQGFLQSKVLFRKEKSPVTTYYLTEDRKGFLTTIWEYLRYESRKGGSDWISDTFYRLLNCKYFQDNWNHHDVKEVLRYRKVKVHASRIQTNSKKGQESSSKWIAFSASFSPKPDGLIEEIEFNFNNGKTLSDAQKTEFVQEYSMDLEMKTLRPIAALLRISPNALLCFLNSWEPLKEESLSYSEGLSGLETVEHILYRLIWNAIYDLSLLKVVPERSGVSVAAVHSQLRRLPDHVLKKHGTPLLYLESFNDNWIYGFETGFDTEHDYYGDDENIVEVEKNPENAWVTIWVETLSEIKTNDGAKDVDNKRPGS